MAEQITRAAWQQMANELLPLYRDQLARHGITPGPDLHLQPDESSPYSYCDLSTGRICLNLPGTDRFGDLLLIMSVGNLVGTQGLGETIRFLRALLPYLLGHELAHYLRERYGAFAASQWVEEHAANRMGMALACTVPAFAAELPFLRRLAEGARERLPLREDQVVGSLRDTHESTVAEIQAFVGLTGADELEILQAAGLEAEVAALHERQERVAKAFNDSYLTDATAYMRRQLAWFCQQVLEPEPPELGAALEAHVLTASWEDRLQAETAAVLARLVGTAEPEEPQWSRAELLALGTGADDRLRAAALAQLQQAGDTEGLLSVLEQAAVACRRYTALKAYAALHQETPSLPEALADAHRLALEEGAEAAATLAGVPLHVVRAGLGGQSGRLQTLTFRLIQRRLQGPPHELAVRLVHAEPVPAMSETEFRQAVRSDADPLVATAAGAPGRLDPETLTELPFLRGARLLRPLRGEELLPLAEAAAEVSGAPGTVLARKGAATDRIFLRENGRFIGLDEALAEAPMRRTVRLPRQGRVLGIGAPAFLSICRGEPKLALVLALHLARRVLQRHSPHFSGALTEQAGRAAPDRPLLPGEKALALLETDLFQGQSSQSLLRIAESFVTRFYPPGSFLAEAGDAARLIVLLSGKVQADTERLGSGAVLGDAECLAGRPWNAPVTAVQATVSLETGHGDFQRLLYMLQGLPFQLARRLAKRVLL